MAKFNDKQRHHFTHNMYVLIADLEMIDRQRARVTKDLLTKCSEIGEVLAKQLSDSSVALRKTVLRMDPEEVSPNSVILTVKVSICLRVSKVR
ncbi:unnamed protein product [Hydatigera taeniaeformis]|uniref:Ribonuclease P n=1 Tax=Hydatigena taeniaeformis TaxID=6205 RepID=A0A0R3XCG7_HYDTA|nr:unnamed protein product [Hydatigera taeniaeformis]